MAEYGEKICEAVAAEIDFFISEFAMWIADLKDTEPKKTENRRPNDI